MRTATILFTYNRSRHTKRVLDALATSKMLPEKLFVFQDGLREDTEPHEWEKVNRLIHGIDWCDREIIVSKSNRGLANSIVSGINHVFSEYEAVIVLEDDCVPAANFINFMQQCFETYRDDKRVYSVSGYTWPLDLPKDQFDVYGCGRISSWGWGTWKDRWEHYSIDNDILSRLKREEEKSRNLAIWGNDLESTIIGNVTGQTDSWAVYWALHVIENRGICINPYQSLIQNIGLDGTGIHCGVTNRFQPEMSDGLKTEFLLPDQISIMHTTESKFADLYKNYTAIHFDEEAKENVLIYGLGNFFVQYEDKLNNLYNIKAFIDKGKKGFYAGRKIIGLKQIAEFNYDRVVIMVQNIQECINIAKELMNRGVTTEHIVLGHDLCGRFGELIDRIAVLPDGRLSLVFGNISIKVKSKDEFYSVRRTFIDQKYKYSINNGKRSIVIDVGMNIGAEALYLANQDNVEKVFGYEQSREFFLIAEENIADNIGRLKTGNVEVFNYGIGGENAVSVRKATEVLKPIVETYFDYNIILKIDCESEGQGIMADLLRSKILMRLTVIMFEGYYGDQDVIFDYLRKGGFSWWCADRNGEMRLIYAYKL